MSQKAELDAPAIRTYMNGRINDTEGAHGHGRRAQRAAPQAEQRAQKTGCLGSANSGPAQDGPGDEQAWERKAGGKRWGKSCRLLKKSEFSLCYHKGKRYFSANFIFFVFKTGLETWRLGLSVSRKIGGATRRNRVKRLLREFFRLNQALLPSGLDMVVVPKKGLDPLRLNYGLVEQELFPLLTGLFKHYGQKRG